MRGIKTSRQFDRDYRRELKGRHGTTLEKSLTPLIDALRADAALETRYDDHPLGSHSELRL